AETAQPARDDLYDALDQSWYRWDPQSMAKGTGIIRLIDAHATEVRAAVLDEAIKAVLGRVEAYEGMGQDAVDRNRERTAIVAQLRRMADGSQP
ncbi:hypothetical protein, partial [Nocardioides sp. NPDC006273]